MEHPKFHQYDNPQNFNIIMDIIVIGAGIGGLSVAICLAQKGHSVSVYEGHDGLSEFGAGIQISPNAIRILNGWGLANSMEEVAFAPKQTNARRYSSGEVLGTTPQNPRSKDIYGFP